MKAYAILDGGGVKGAALAGCLKAADEHNIQFKGYGGTSAGSIIALLACVGYTADEIQTIMTEEIEFSMFLDDGGLALERLKTILVSPPWSVFRCLDLLFRIYRNCGLYQAQPLQDFLLTKIKTKLPRLRHRSDITFDDLTKEGCVPLKIVATDLRNRSARIYSASGGHDYNGSVIDAVRASMSYPFVFCPVLMNNTFLVDGGVSSNLPIFLFENERRTDRSPVIAFDLVTSPRPRRRHYRAFDLGSDMIGTALEASDILLQEVVKGLYHVRVEIPQDINTLDFTLARPRRRDLFNAGCAATHSFLTQLPQLTNAKTQVQQLQAAHASPKVVVPVLETIAKEFAAHTNACDVRCHIMLPTDHGTNLVVYQHGMNSDADIDLELEGDAGCSGQAWSEGKLAVADLDDAKTKFANWKMTREQQNKVRLDRLTMLSIPIRERPRPGLAETDRASIGILSVDTCTPINDTTWLVSRGPDMVEGAVLELAGRWAEILGQILT